jgi:beta-lactamase superfamily II metal-dependent hydrolase
MIALLIAILLACPQATFAQTSLRVHFVDVGQGDAVLIQSPSGQNVVYDGGQSPTRVSDFLRSLGVARIELVVASHNHSDHIGGLADVVERYRPKFYLDNGIPATTLVYRRLLDAVTKTGAQLLEPTARRIAVGAVMLEVLPPPGVVAWSQNNNSVGLIVEYGAFRLSLGGDAEQRQWAWWIDHFPQAVRAVQVHKSSHHGSENGDSATGLARLTPEVVVISAGEGNSFGHPRPETLRLYAGGGSTVYRTDLHGTILVEAEMSGQYTVRVEHGDTTHSQTTQFSGRSASLPRILCININTAGLADLQRIVHIDLVRAREIILRRTNERLFLSVAALVRVRTIRPVQLRDILEQGSACVQ